MRFRHPGAGLRSHFIRFCNSSSRRISPRHISGLLNAVVGLVAAAARIVVDRTVVAVVGHIAVVVAGCTAVAAGRIAVVAALSLAFAL